MSGPAARPTARGASDVYVRPGFDLGDVFMRTMDAWSGYAFVALDRAGRVEFYTRRMRDLTGYTMDDIGTGSFLDSLFPTPAAAAQALRALQEFIDGAAANQTFHWTIRRKDGGSRTVWANTVAVPDGRGARVSVFMSCRDVTEYPGALGYDRATQRGFEELVESAPDAFARFRTSDRRCVYINRVIERLTGFPPQAFYQDPGLWARLMPVEDRPTFEQAFAATAAGGEPREIDYRWQIGERTLHLAHKLYPIKDDTGAVFALEGMVQDLSGRRALERRLNQLLDDKDAVNVALEARMREIEAANQKLRSLDKLKSEILANVSHELRTPLVTICGYAELLLDRGLGALNKRQTHALEVTRRSGRRLKSLIENMLEYAKLEEGRVILRRERIDLRDCAREVAEEIGARLGPRRIRFEVALPTEAVTVSADRTRLLLLLRNLLGNAEKFTAEDGEIGLGLALDGGQALLTVRDTGIGIPPEHHERIFDRFYQVDGSATRQHGGAGLGLAIVREVVEMHGGRVSVDSAPGRGSRFEVRLPLAPAVDRRERRGKRERRASARRSS